MKRKTRSVTKTEEMEHARITRYIVLPLIPLYRALIVSKSYLNSVKLSAWLPLTSKKKVFEAMHLV